MSINGFNREYRRLCMIIWIGRTRTEQAYGVCGKECFAWSESLLDAVESSMQRISFLFSYGALWFVGSVLMNSYLAIRIEYAPNKLIVYNFEWLNLVEPQNDQHISVVRDGEL